MKSRERKRNPIGEYTLQEKRKTKWIIYFSAKGIKNMNSRERKRNPIGNILYKKKEIKMDIYFLYFTRKWIIYIFLQ
jgi:hypothetical protein